MGKGGSTTTTQTMSLDPSTQAYKDWYQQQAQAAAKRAGGMGQITAGPGAASAEAGRLYSGAGAGYGDLARQNLGFASGPLSGMDLSGYLNPHESGVIGGVQSDFDRQRGLASARAGDLATQEGAFGGSRSALLEAQGLRDVNQQETNTLANLRYGGFMNAQDRAMADRAMAANLGMAGLGGQLQAGQGLMDLDAYRQAIATQQNMDPLMRSRYALEFGQMGMNTPYGMTNTTTEERSGNWFNDLLGLGMTAGGFLIGGPAGAAAGSGIANASKGG